MLGFNEPNNCGNAGSCITVSQALADWQTIEAAVGPTTKLVCPATGTPDVTTGHSTNDWFHDFALGDANRDGTLGDNGGYIPRCDAIAWHYYLTAFNSGNIINAVSDLKTKASTIYGLYGKQIWVTELGAGQFIGPPGVYPTGQQASDIVTNIVQLVMRDSTNHFARWSWYPNAAMAQLITDDPNYANITLSNLDGSLTALGTRYSTLW